MQIWKKAMVASPKNEDFYHNFKKYLIRTIYMMFDVK